MAEISTEPTNTQAALAAEITDREPYCNHDTVAVHNGVCECGTDITALRSDMGRVRCLLLKRDDIIVQGRFIRGGVWSYPAVPVLRYQGHGGERCYVTHLAIVKDDDAVYFETGHYDLTWDQAVEDVNQR